jgi:hypothetical protein
VLFVFCALFAVLVVKRVFRASFSVVESLEKSREVFFVLGRFRKRKLTRKTWKRWVKIYICSFVFLLLTLKAKS